MKCSKQILSLFLVSLILTACSGKSNNASYFKEEKNINVEHVHGIGYIGNKNDLFLASHNGLVKYSNQKWFSTSKNNNDYMGFQAVNNGFYSSGHPEQGSSLKNPLGLIKSTDEGKTFKKLGFYGESDFHYLAAGYESHEIYVINESPNSILDSGLFHSSDEGKSWKQSKMGGFSANSVGTIATHPTEANKMAISTDKGLYLSNNYGDTFEVISNPKPVSTVSFENSSILYVIVDGNHISLNKQDLNTKKVSEITLPSKVTVNNPVMLIASNPKNNKDISIVTYKNDVYQTKNGGATWKQLLNNGKGKS